MAAGSSCIAVIAALTSNIFEDPASPIGTTPEDIRDKYLRGTPV